MLQYNGQLQFSVAILPALRLGIEATYFVWGWVMIKESVRPTFLGLQIYCIDFESEDGLR